MSDKRVIAVTGVAGYWGARLAARLANEPGSHLIGIDVRPPVEPIKGVDFIQADIRNPLMLDLFKAEGVDTLCHLAFIDRERVSESAFDLNVMGTMKAFGAAVEAGVRKIVFKSSTAVYGARSTNSAFLDESHPLRGSQRSGTIRNLMEIEAFCNGFRREHPDTLLTILRFPSIVGPTARTPMTRFLRETYAPMLLGFDPMMQVIHELDVIEALVYAVENDIPGAYNIAAEGVMPLSRVVGLAGRFPLPVLHPLAYWGRDLFNSSPLLGRFVPIEPDYLRYPWVGDLRKMEAELDFTPQYTAEEALREFAGLRHAHYGDGLDDLDYDAERLKDTIERRRRARARREEQ
jgi:UDP-glucose 4-epimerase